MKVQRYVRKIKHWKPRRLKNKFKLKTGLSFRDHL